MIPQLPSAPLTLLTIGQRVIIKGIEALGTLVDFERTYLSPFQLNELLAKT